MTRSEKPFDKTTNQFSSELTPNVSDSFTEQLKQALEQFTKPDWLGKYSLLAQPYFLGERLTGNRDAHTEVGRGKVLQQVVLEGAVALNQQSDEQRLKGNKLRA